MTDLVVQTFPTRSEMSAATVKLLLSRLHELLETKDSLRLVFAAAPSQAVMLEMLASDTTIDWSRVTAFHMDEYIGLDPDDPARFGAWLERHFFDHVPLRATHLMKPEPDPEAACAHYAALLAEAPIDIVCMGIGVNGHIAFNDPPVADFNDPLDVKVVDLDQTCRQQQVDDECFPDIDAVPRRAMTLTVPRLLAADSIFCVVPGRHKRDAVRGALHGSISTQCPASILRTHPDCTILLDKESNPDD